MIPDDTSAGRRRFLAAAAATAMSGVVPVAVAAAPRLRLGLVTYQWGKAMSLPDLLAVCERTGFTGVELRSTHAHGVEPGMR
ncbi:MAG: sugar phosphate isomerase/epimerase, partial [Planctomycetaceae bacterium]